MQEIFMTSPLFGRCRLVPHDVDEKPVGAAVGYVELAGSLGTYPLAMNLRGEWRNRQDKPFGAAVIRWFSLAKLDGSPLFNSNEGDGHD